jgi:hypothetical protein
MTIVLLAVCGGLVSAVLLYQGCAGTDCGPGTVEQGGQCVPVCGPGTYLGSDGLCHPLAADADADARDDGIAGPDADADAELGVDGDGPVDVPREADGEGGAEGDAPAESREDIVRDIEVDPDSGVCSDPTSCESAAREMFELMNADRATAGCPAFTWDDRLAASALECVNGMAAADSFSGCSEMGGRLRAQGFTSYADAGEFYIRHRTVVGAEDMVVTDEEAPNYLLKCSFTLAGVAVATAADGRSMWFCQSYLTP